MAVRDMLASMSASHHMLSAPQAPAPAAMADSVATSFSQSIVTRRQRKPDRAGEDDQRHDAGLEKNEMVDHASARPLPRQAPVGASTRASVNATCHPDLAVSTPSAPEISDKFASMSRLPALRRSKPRARSLKTGREVDCDQMA